MAREVLAAPSVQGHCVIIVQEGIALVEVPQLSVDSIRADGTTSGAAPQAEDIVEPPLIDPGVFHDRAHKVPTGIVDLIEVKVVLVRRGDQDSASDTRGKER